MWDIKGSTANRAEQLLTWTTIYSKHVLEHN